MTTVTREQFKTTFARGIEQSEATRKQLDAAGVDGEALLDGADVDGNGVVNGERELDALWRSVDDFDHDGWRSSVSDKKPLAVIAALQTAASAAPTKTPRLSPLDLALQELSAADEGDGVSASEIDVARAHVAVRYGEAVADDVMQQGLGLKLSSLDESGADWVQQHQGSMNGQIDRYQAALRTHLKGAKLIDANFDGQLDAGDQLWTKDAAGKVSLQRLEPALLDRVKIGGAMIGAAEEMDRAGHSFALIKDHTFNAKYWTPIGGGSFKLNPGVKPSAAFDDIFKNPQLYKFECATALVITQYKAMRDLLGAADFDRACSDLEIGPWQTESTLDAHTVLSGSEAEATPERKASLKAGDYGYFKNWDVSDEGRDGGWQGENVIYLGDGRFYGHPFGVADEKTIVDHLNTQRNAGSTRSASFLDLRSELSSSLLREDRVDG
jgi:protein-glutamine gamma-glutamyltransferase